MTKEIIERCQEVVDKYNTIYCQNDAYTTLKLNTLKNTQEGGFILWLDVDGHLTRICRVESIPINPALAEIQINKLFLPDLLLTENDSTVCDCSLVHLILECICSTGSMNRLLYEQRSFRR